MILLKICSEYRDDIRNSGKIKKSGNQLFDLFRIEPYHKALAVLHYRNLSLSSSLHYMLHQFWSVDRDLFKINIYR